MVVITYSCLTARELVWQIWLKRNEMGNSVYVYNNIGAQIILGAQKIIFFHIILMIASSASIGLYKYFWIRNFKFRDNCNIESNPKVRREIC